MKKAVVSILVLANVYSVAQAQNVGVDVAVPQQKLDVAGAIRIGTTGVGLAGTLRWSGTEFQYHDGTQWVTLAANTDDQQFDLIQLNGSNLEFSIENDGQAPHVIDLSGFLDNTDDQTIDFLSIVGNTLQISLEGDGQPIQSVDLAPYLDNTDDQTLDVFSLTGTTLNLSLEDDGQATQTIDLDPLRRILVDADADTKIEVEAAPDEDAIRFTTAASERMRILSDGKVGIGTSTPGSRLTVYGTASDTEPAMSITSGNDQNGFNNGAQLAFGYDGDNEYMHFIQTRHNQTSLNNNAIDFYLNNGTTANNSVGTGSILAMSLNGNNVGIGTSTPGQQLSLAGNVDQGQVFMDGGDELHIRNSQQNNEILISDGSGGIRLEYNDTEIMRVVANVGIGTTSPSQKLEVAGNVRISALNGGANKPVYADVNGDLTTTGPTSGANGYWTRTGTVLRPTNVGDEVDMGDQTLFMRDNSGNTFGMGFGTEGGSELTIFTDNLLDFTESDTDVLVMRIEGNNGRVEIPGSTDATATAGSGVLEIADALRLDGNEIITNTNAILYINSDNGGDVQMDGGTFHLDASTNRVGIGTTSPAYTLETVAGGSVSVNDGYLRKVKALYLQDWDDDTGGSDDKYRLLGRDGAWQFYNGGVVVGNYGNGTWGDLSDGYLIVESRVGVGTTAPTRDLDVNGTVRIRGGGATAGDFLMSQDANGNATWSAAGYGLVPIGTIVAWHGNMAGVPGLPTGWLECNGQVISDAASPMNGQSTPNLNGGTTASGGGATRGRFLRGHTTSGSFESDRTNNFYRWHQDDSDGGPNGWDNNLSQTGGWNGYMGSYHSNDRRRFHLRGGETRPTNMSVRWIIRVK